MTLIFENETIQQIILNTKKYEEKYDKSVRSNNCQYFTPYDIAVYMSEMFEIYDKESLNVLDPCGGTGILDLCIIDSLLKKSKLKNLCIDIYEKDPVIIQTLKKNIKIIKNNLKNNVVKVEINVIQDNYILHNTDFWKQKQCGEYDIIIGNPPYKKIGKNSDEAKAMNDIVYGQPNLYMLFLAMSVLHMKDLGQLVFLVPRSFCNGKYFKEFRKWLKINCCITNIHSFQDRSKIINDEVLQELIIIKIEKANKSNIVIGHSKNNLDLNDSKKEEVDSTFIWERSDMERIRLPLLVGDDVILNIFEKFSSTMQKCGIVFSTGPVVDFRVKSGLEKTASVDTVPVVWSAHFGKYEIEWPNKKKEKLSQYIKIKGNENILVDMNDYILIKRFSSKEENGIKINIMWKDNFSYKQIGIENHVNYAKCEDETLLIAVFILLKSKIYNRYFKIINGTTQVNVSDLNVLPVPPLIELKKIGKKLDKSKLSILTSNECDQIICEFLKTVT